MKLAAGTAFNYSWDTLCYRRLGHLTTTCHLLPQSVEAPATM